jgi:hypothetical protein
MASSSLLSLEIFASWVGRTSILGAIKGSTLHEKILASILVANSLDSSRFFGILSLTIKPKFPGKALV